MATRRAPSQGASPGGWGGDRCARAPVRAPSAMASPLHRTYSACRRSPGAFKRDTSMRHEIRIQPARGCLWSLLLLWAAVQPAASAAQASPVVPEGPVGIFPAPVFNFGTVPAGTIVRHDFVLRNRGTADLLILAVRSTCGCTVGKPSAKRIPPGKSATIRLRFDTKGRGGKERKTLFVVTNDVLAGVLKCRIEGSVVPAGASVVRPAEPRAPEPGGEGRKAKPPAGPNPVPAPKPAFHPPRLPRLLEERDPTVDTHRGPR